MEAANEREYLRVRVICKVWILDFLRPKIEIVEFETF